MRWYLEPDRAIFTKDRIESIDASTLTVAFPFGWANLTSWSVLVSRLCPNDIFQAQFQEGLIEVTLIGLDLDDVRR